MPAKTGSTSTKEVISFRVSAEVFKQLEKLGLKLQSKLGDTLGPHEVAREILLEALKEKTNK